MKVKICLIVLLFCFFGIRDYSIYDRKIIWPGSSLIGHGMFGIDGVTYTNSKESFYNGYNLGIRTFEIDLGLTSDDVVVLVHDWDRFGYVPSSDSFLSNKILDRYTSLSIIDVLLLIKIYPDVWFVTDSKYVDSVMIKKEFSYIVDVAKRYNLLLELDHLVIQLYNQEMYSIIESIYHFDNYLYTMYMNWQDNYNKFVEICDWGKDKLRGIVLFDGWYNVNLLKIVKSYGLDLYVHTVNDLLKSKMYFRDGVRGIYTDFITC